MSFGAQILMARRRLECWPIWIAVDFIGVWLYWQKGTVFVSGLYGVFLVMAVLGLLSWRRQTPAGVLPKRFNLLFESLTPPVQTSRLARAFWKLSPSAITRAVCLPGPRRSKGMLHAIRFGVGDGRRAPVNLPDQAFGLHIERQLRARRGQSP